MCPKNIYNPNPNPSFHAKCESLLPPLAKFIFDCGNTLWSAYKIANNKPSLYKTRKWKLILEMILFFKGVIRTCCQNINPFHNFPYSKIFNTSMMLNNLSRQSFVNSILRRHVTPAQHHWKEHPAWILFPRDLYVLQRYTSDISMLLQI